MSKLEYSDFYKFIASVGTLLIALSVLVPWLFLREPFDLLQKQDDINLLTPLAQSIVQNRQSAIYSIGFTLPIFSMIMFMLGGVALVKGGLMWHQKTQKLLDRITELTVKDLEQKLGRFSTEQKEEEVKGQLLDEEENNLTPSNINTLVEEINKIEQRITGLLGSCFAQTHTVLTERSLGPVNLDIVMPAKSTLHSDYTIELKYIRKGFKFNWLRDNVLKIVYANQLYKEGTNRQAVPVLFIVGSDKSALPTSIDKEKYLLRIENELKNLNSKAIIILISQSDLYNIDCIKMKALLKI